MKFGVRIMPRSVLLDTQGRTVEKVLRDHSYELDSLRVGKYVEIELNEKEAGRAEEKIKAMTEFVLYNPLIETFVIERREG